MGVILPASIDYMKPIKKKRRRKKKDRKGKPEHLVTYGKK
jgi:hypothetical protein